MRDCWEQCRFSASQQKAAALSTALGSPPSSPLFPGTLPSTLPSTFGDLGSLSPVAGGRDSYVRSRRVKNGRGDFMVFPVGVIAHCRRNSPFELIR